VRQLEARALDRLFSLVASERELRQAGGRR
jgi:hypothetical protein